MPITGSTLIPSAKYADAYAAIRWLCEVFGFHEHAVYGDGTRVEHAELALDGGMFMLGSLPNTPHAIALSETGGRETLGLYLVLADTRACYDRARRAGAEIVMDLYQPSYGGDAFACRDPEGHIWSVGSYDPWSRP